MAISQNLRFTANVKQDAGSPHPPGVALMRCLGSELSKVGWSTEEMDNWRDIGWCVACRRAASVLEVIVAQIEEGQWMLQIIPKNRPGLLGRMFRRKASATPSDVHELAIAVHQALFALQYLGNPQWSWDRLPNEKHSTPEPRVA